ncbi:Ig-like domain-containing protein [Cerasicoccus maritimus]|uniref:Ig-like domain-containing protein n=1 Tax=Cerasicoccus maritimus TaxID=490089 RepID=UPI002852B523|nr:Ig-like domain-containing protein [Cerasicoccus maritimus]
MNTPKLSLICLLFMLVSPLWAYDTLPDRNPIPNIAEAQEVVAMWADIDASAPSITLNFLFEKDYEIYRRIYGETDWGAALTNSTGLAASWTDSTVITGVCYEYAAKVVDEAVYGYLTAGIGVDEAGPRGTLILVIAENIIVGNEDRLKTLLEDLVGDGWKVRTILTPVYDDKAFNFESNACLGIYSYDYTRELRNQIRDIYNEDPAGTKMLYFLGHTPTAQTGLQMSHPDGHGSRSAYVTDYFYADMDGVWSDSKFSNASLSTSDELTLPNVPGDGIYDPNTMPSTLELAHGRVDPFNSNGVDSVLGETHAVTVAGYLDKAHHYKHYEPFGPVGSEVLIGRRTALRYNGGGQQGNVCTAMQFLGMVGLGNALDYHNTSGLSDYEYITANGPFLYYGQNSSSPPSGDTELYGLAAHRFSMQSWWGDWFANESSRINLFRPENMTMTWSYGGRWDSQYHLHLLGMGKTFGEAFQLSQNYEFNEYFTGSSTPSFESREYLRNLVGDPSLRLFPVAPAQSPTATRNGSSVDLAWSAPVELSEFVEYRIYRATSLLSDFALIATGVTATTFTDDSPLVGSNVYMIQAVHEVASGGGTFFTNAQGVFASVGLTIDQPILPPFPVGEDVDFDLTVSGANGSPTWSLATGILPPGLELLSTGKLQGNPIAPGQYRLTLQVIDDDSAPVEIEYSLLIDGDMTEILNLDLRANGLGIADKSHFQRSFTVWGNPQVGAEGTVFDGDDAIQVHSMGEGTDDFTDYNMLPHGNGKNWTITLDFKAEPDSQGGVLISRAYNLITGWTDCLTNYAIYMQADGTVRGQITSRRATTSESFNDGQWHQATFRGNGDFYVDNVLIGNALPASKTVDHDMLIGARWEDSTGSGLADCFDGMIANVRVFRSQISDGEIRSLYERFTRERTDVSPHAPTIAGLPTIAPIDPDNLGDLRFPFTATDEDGEPIKFVMIPSDLEAVTHYEVVQTSSGYELFVQLVNTDNAPQSLLIAAEDGWPGHTDMHTIDFVFAGGSADSFKLGLGPSRLDVLANDISLDGETMSFGGIVGQPAQGYVRIEDGEVVFYPPTLWDRALTFEYALNFEPSGETRNVTVTVAPDNLPQPGNDQFDMTGVEAVLFDVLGNDVDPAGEMLTLVRVDQPARGSVRIVDGQVEYTPSAGYSLPTDSFTYAVRNESGFVASAAVAVNRTDIALSDPLVNLLLDETTGSVAANSGTLGSTADGTVSGTASWVSGLDGNALSFDGATNYVSLGNPAELNFNPATDSFSIVMMVYLDVTTQILGSNYTLLCKANDAGDTQFVLEAGNVPTNVGSFYAGAHVQVKGDYIEPYASSPLASLFYELVYYWPFLGDNDWKQVSVINDAQTRQLSIYVDQCIVAQVDTSAMDWDQADTGTPWIIGARPDGAGGYKNFFVGEMDNIVIYDRAIEPTELKPYLALGGFETELSPVAERSGFTPGVENTFAVGKAYTFTPDYIDGDSVESEIDVQWQVYDPNARTTEYIDSYELNYTFSSAGSWRIRYSVWNYSMNRSGQASASDYIYLTVAEMENLVDTFRLTTSSPLAVAAEAEANVAIAATGGETPYAFSLVNGALPAGLTLNADGSITGQTSATGLHVFEVMVVDAVGAKILANYQLRVTGADGDLDGMPDDWELANLGGSGMGPGDRDSFGVPALVRYALGVDAGLPVGYPFTMGYTRDSMVNGDDQYFVIEFQRRSNLAGIDVELKCSTDLSEWSVVDAVQEVVADDGELQTIEIRAPRAGDDAKFFQLSVE